MQLWGDGQVCELLPRADEKNRLEAKQLADKQEKEDGYAPLCWLVIHMGFLPVGSKWREGAEGVGKLLLQLLFQI